MKNEEPIMVAPLASKRARYLWRLLQLSISYQQKLPWFNQFNDFKFPNTMEVYEPWHGEIQKTTASVFPRDATPVQFNIDTKHSDTFEKPLLLVYI